MVPNLEDRHLKIQQIYRLVFDFGSKFELAVLVIYIEITFIGYQILKSFGSKSILNYSICI